MCVCFTVAMLLSTLCSSKNLNFSFAKYCLHTNKHVCGANTTSTHARSTHIASINECDASASNVFSMCGITLIVLIQFGVCAPRVVFFPAETTAND